MAKIRTGLCSVTLRTHTISAVVDVASRAGLSSIEWGGDIHCPPGDLQTAQYAKVLTAEAGLAVASYGSYFDSAVHGLQEASAVVATAVALGAPRIRVWAAHLVEWADSALVETVVRNTNTLSSLAADKGITVAFEFHEGTLTASALEVREILDRCSNNVGSYWQPFSGPARPDSDSLGELVNMVEHVRALHVFYYRDARQLPIARGSQLWLGALKTISDFESPSIDALLEFVPDPSEAGVLQEATTLRSLIAEAQHPLRA